VNRAWSPASLSYRILGIVGVAFLLSPLIIVVWLSFGSSAYMAKPGLDLSFRWYHAVASETRWTVPLQHSLIIAAGSALLSLALAVPAALGLAKSQSRRSGILTFAVMVPFFMPGLILAVGLLMFTSRFGLSGTYPGIMIAHSLWGAPIAFLAVRAVYAGVDQSAEEAARVLGAGPFRTFFLITLRAILPGVAAGALFAFVISFNEFMMSLFLTSPSTVTLPVVIWTSLRYEVSPAVAAIASVFIGISLLAVLVGLKLVGRRGLANLTTGEGDTTGAA
jgi:putative spermidine/putrescine transport system permease protein